MRFDRAELDFRVHKDNPWNNIKKQYFKHLVKFMDIDGASVKVYGDSEYILYLHLARKLHCSFLLNYIDVIWVFDVIESQINPINTLLNIWNGAEKETRIFITCPHRSWTATWSHNHWHEIDPERFKWLADYCGFEVVRHESHTIWQKWYHYIGFRPLLRLLFGRYKLHIYELRIK